MKNKYPKLLIFIFSAVFIFVLLFLSWVLIYVSNFGYEHHLITGNEFAIKFNGNNTFVSNSANPDKFSPLFGTKDLRPTSLSINGKYIVNSSTRDSQVCVFIVGDLRIEAENCIPNEITENLNITNLSVSVNGDYVAIEYLPDTWLCKNDNYPQSLSVYYITGISILRNIPNAYLPKFSPAVNSELSYLSSDCEGTRTVNTINIESGNISRVETSGFTYGNDGKIVLVQQPKCEPDKLVYPVLTGDGIMVYSCDPGMNSTNDSPEKLVIGNVVEDLQVDQAVHVISFWDNQLAVTYFDTDDRHFATFYK